LKRLDACPCRQIMEGIVELVVEVIGAIVHAIFEVIFGRIALFVGSIYNGIYRTVRWNLNSDFLAIPVTLLLMLALSAATFFATVKAIRWMIA
jgi:hypothetical protein